MFFPDAIAPIVNRVLRKLGIKDDVKQYKMEIDTAKDYSNAHTLLDGELVRISDLSPSTNEIIGATFSYTAKGASNPTSGTITNDTIMPFNGIFGITATGYKMLDGIFVFTEVDGINIETPGTYAARDFLGAIESTATITWKTETITPIFDKYLPGVCLPVVELTTEPAINGYVTLTTDECSALNAAFEKKMPVVCQFGLMGMTVSIPLMYIVNPADSSGYLGTSPFGDLYLTVGNAGNWAAMYRPEG
jgi:hypothetical protein